MREVLVTMFDYPSPGPGGRKIHVTNTWGTSAFHVVVVSPRGRQPVGDIQDPAAMNALSAANPHFNWGKTPEEGVPGVPVTMASEIEAKARAYLQGRVLPPPLS